MKTTPMNRFRLLFGIFLIILVLPLSLWSCVSESEYTEMPTTVRSGLTVERAMILSQQVLSDIQTRSTTDSRVPFLMGEATVWEWDCAETSHSSHYSAVDIPVTNNYQYKVYRKQPNGEYSSVFASSKVVVVQDDRTGDVSF